MLETAINSNSSKGWEDDSTEKITLLRRHEELSLNPQYPYLKKKMYVATCSCNGSSRERTPKDCWGLLARSLAPVSGRDLLSRELRQRLVEHPAHLLQPLHACAQAHIHLYGFICPTTGTMIYQESEVLAKAHPPFSYSLL